jgi:hypothetical protein
MAKRAENNYTPRTKVKRRRKPRPFNHKKKIGKRSAFAGQKSKNRGQG